MKQGHVNIDQLRERAMEALKKAAGQHIDNSGRSPDSLIEELRVYQTELEMQNQELVNAQSITAATLNKYQNFFEQLPLAGVVIDERGFIVEANVQARKIFRLKSASALLNRSVFQQFVSSGREKLYRALQDRDRRGPHVAYGVEIVSDSDDVVTVDVHVIHLEDETGGGERTLLVLADRSADIALHNHDERISKIATHVPGVIYQYQRWPDGRSSFPFASDRIVDIYGVTPEG